jgi:hypothetical protein
MGIKQRHAEKVNLSLPEELWQRMAYMQRTRDMSLNTLVSELVQLGLTQLDYPKPEPTSTLQGIDPSGEGFVRR